MPKAALDFTTPFLVISITYIAAFWTSIYVLQPFQTTFTPQLASYASLLFLPHGVRILSAWLLGWKSIPLIAPAALFTHWINFGAEGFTPLGIAGAFSGVVSAAFSFWLLAKLGMDFRISNGNKVNWMDVIIAGCAASLINTFGMGYVFQHNTLTSMSYFVGDVSGLFACMFLLMIVFSVARTSQQIR